MDGLPAGVNGGSVGLDLAIDFGTAKTLVHVSGRGFTLEPSVVALDIATGELLGFGAEAMRVVGSSPGHIRGHWPLRPAVDADPEICKRLLQYFINSAHPARSTGRRRVVVCLPSDLADGQKAALEEVGEKGAHSFLYLIEASLAAAIGAGMPVGQPIGNMVVDIGRDGTRSAVIALSGFVTSHSVRVGGDELDRAIQRHIRTTYGLILAERTAEETKIKQGWACPPEAELYSEVRGRDHITGRPRTIVTSAGEIHEAISEQVGAIVGAVKATVEKTPPELAADIMEQGIVLTGGGALLNGLDFRLNKETGMPVVVTDNPFHSVVIGGAKFLDEL